MTGKIVPYIMIGLVQVTLLLVAALALFKVPLAGSVLLLYLAVLLFIAVLGIMLKDTGPAQLWPDIWPILAFLAAAIAVGLSLYRKTLD